MYVPAYEMTHLVQILLIFYTDVFMQSRKSVQQAEIRYNVKESHNFDGASQDRLNHLIIQVSEPHVMFVWIGRVNENN
jgi:hypothetical protein